MVNWTNQSQGLEGTWKNDEKYDLPVPDSGYDCMGWIHETEDLLSLFNCGTDSMADEFEIISGEAVDLLEQLSPRTVSIQDYSSDWENGVKIWLLKIEICHTIQARNELHANYLKDVCELYLERLKERFNQLMGEKWEEE